MGYLVLVFEISIPAEPIPDICRKKPEKCLFSELISGSNFHFLNKMPGKKPSCSFFLTVLTGMPVLQVAQRQKQYILSSHRYSVSFPLNPQLTQSLFQICSLADQDSHSQAGLATHHQTKIILGQFSGLCLCL